MKRLTVFIFIVAISGAVSCSSRKKISDIREFIDEVSATQDDFLSQLDKSLNADDAQFALKTFANNMIRLSEKSAEIKRKYPDIDKLVSDPPAELQADFKKLENSESKFEEVFRKDNIKIILKDKKVQSALVELNTKMENVKFFKW